MTTKIDIRSLPHLAPWADADPQFTPLTWLYAEANVEMAVAFTALFWPDLVEHNGGVFLRAFFDPEVFAQWQEKLGDDIAAIERVMNHRHVGDLLPGAEHVGSGNLRHLGRVLAATWQARLAEMFPHRQLEVRCNEAPEDEDVVITFFQNLLQNSL